MFDIGLSFAPDCIIGKGSIFPSPERFIVFKDGGEIVRFLSFGVAKYLVNRDKFLTGSHYVIVSSKTGEVLYEL